MVIQLIVEGHGEVEASNRLLSRVLTTLGQQRFKTLAPIRVPRDVFFSEEKLTKYLKLARSNGAKQVLALYDADDDCAVEAVERTRSIMAAECPDLRYEAVAAVREYEAWLLAGSRGFLGEADPPRPHAYEADPESKRDAKGELALFLGGRGRYSPTVDQLRLTKLFDLADAQEGSRSFRAFYSAVGRLREPIPSEAGSE